ncbi:PREDICTED: ribonucleases P/MRP protein subunit POP1 [Ceratosolen solmsi marchali]|uniref:Ribonucleases P/MRP protein subunit POP1 n=1 Tax=Ceratosolen solmsi marchali TaxID=326594 RepID=A0AAJ6YTU7_9HYME|nr:PREDICTED: ribonucleases P/MRP protein subunit POP1 [Ceratosolen solmsi marchali]
MSDKKQFDEYLGGSERLPDNAQILKLASARASEIAAMTYSLENPHQTKLIFQKLPVHMRRRVMSHNAKRMPRRLRASHLSQMNKSGLPPKSKRPSRKYRRRPYNLLLEYNRRQRNKFWLETHIWHAKRFQMIEKWGFKLANYSNDRCFRANYRAVINHCLIQDISYYTCIEITGPIVFLTQKLKMHCNPNELTFGAKCYINGEREGTLMFYKANGYPYHPIGYINFMWNANSCSSKAIWIWVHPALYKDTLEEIINNFNFVLETNSNTSDTIVEKDQDIVKDLQAETMSSELKIFRTTKVPIYTNNNECQLTILRNCLNRFRLSGPLTLNTLTDAFKLPHIRSKFDVMNQSSVEVDKNFEKMDIQDNQNLCEIDIKNQDKTKYSTNTWYNIYYQSEKNLETFKVQNDMFNNLVGLNFPSQLPPNMILALTVLDPRFFLPEKRIKSLSNSQITESILVPPRLANESPLWDSNVRNYVTKNYVSTSVINNLRSQSLVPGVHNDQFYNENIMHKIPIIFIQKPGNYVNNNNINFGAGIDIILPSGWSMPFWLALILRCARVGGLRESKSIAYETPNLNVPDINHPDTNAYKVEASKKRIMLIERHYKLPSNKRVNYTKLGISSPFFCEWSLLIKEWNNVDNFYILRDNHILSTLNTKICMSLEKKRKNIHKNIDKNNASIDLDDLIKDKDCFVPIKVINENKGLPKDFSIICIPTKDDLIKYNEDKTWSGPVQSVLKSENRESKKMKKKTKKKRKKLKSPSFNLLIKLNRNKIQRLARKKLKQENKNRIENQTKYMLSIDCCKVVRYSCDREVIGYVTQGGFSYQEAKGIGLGYVILSSVFNLIKEKSNIVLTRNTTTRKYRICKLEILS